MMCSPYGLLKGHWEMIALEWKHGDAHGKATLMARQMPVLSCPDLTHAKALAARSSRTHHTLCARASFSADLVLQSHSGGDICGADADGRGRGGGRRHGTCRRRRAGGRLVRGSARCSGGADVVLQGHSGGNIGGPSVDGGGGLRRAHSLCGPGMSSGRHSAPWPRMDPHQYMQQLRHTLGTTRHSSTGAPMHSPAGGSCRQCAARSNSLAPSANWVV